MPYRAEARPSRRPQKIVDTHFDRESPSKPCASLNSARHHPGGGVRNLLAIGSVALISSCSMGGSDICTPVPDLAADTGPDSVSAMARRDPVWLERRAANCIHRWGYRLAPSQDEGLTVAKAVMQACEGAVTQHAEAYGAQMADAMQKSYASGVVDVLERDDYAAARTAEKMAQLEREAHFRVQTARAGKCKA